MEITPEAAGALAKHAGYLFLPRLRDLSDSVAKALARHQGPALFLEGVESLSVKAAEAFGGYAGEYLSLGLRSLPLAQAKALAYFPGNTLDLNHLEIESAEVKAVLKPCGAKVLYASGGQL